MMVLTYLSDLSRVRVALSAITPDGAVRVEKAALTADPPWEVVRGATQLPIVSGAGQVDDYEFYADVENWYRVLRVDPVPGLQLDGASGNYASTPDDPALDIVGDITMSAIVALEDYESTNQALVSKWDQAGDQRSYRMLMASDGRLQIQWTTDGTAATINTDVTTNPLGLEPGQRIGLMATLDVDDGDGNHVVRYRTFDPDTGVARLVDTNTLTGTTSIFSGTAILEVGASDTGTANLATGVIDSVTVTSDPFGVPAEAANPDFAAQTSGTTSFTDDAGRDWVVNGGAEILGEIVEAPQSITPDLEGQTWIKSIKYPALNRPIGEAPDYRPVQRSSRTGVYNIKGRVPPIAIYDAWTSRWWTMEFVTNALAEARDMDLVLAASRTLFIHVPAEQANECFTNPVSGMPGGYVMAQNATMRHVVGGSHSMQWILPVRVVAPPKPEIAGATLTWNTVMRLFGSWEALWASFPTWNDLWATIMDPEDAINL